jgi:hypothetical protein
MNILELKNKLQKHIAIHGVPSAPDCSEPDFMDYARQCMAKPDYKQEMENAYNTYLTSEDDEDSDDMTPSQENEWLRSGGF